ncbi:MAG TPA: preprotein translocase subunit SecE, partial [Pyrinomonadaceae bacterium]|nr:preprotein translocase subunit SecE [Pyrinomonadaceae bacterium]
MADKIKIGLAALLVVAGLAGFYFFSDSPAIVRVALVLAGLAAASFVFWLTAPGKQFYVYSQESIAETKKVVWPTRKETLQTTGVVFLF